MKELLSRILPNHVGQKLADQMEEHYLPSLLKMIDADAYETVKRLGNMIPVALTGFWGYEISLSDNSRKPDVLFCIHNARAFQRAFGTEGANVLPGILKENASYQRLNKLAEVWATPKQELYRRINNIWFEYDFEDLEREVPIPNFFFAPREDSNALEIIWHTRLIMSLLSEGGDSKEAYPWLMSCMEHLPEKAWISQIGRMLARKEPNLRLYIQDIPKKGIASYLQKLSYPYWDDEVFKDKLELCERFASQVDLDLDILDKIGDAIGLECYFDKMEEVLHFLSLLRDRDLCTEEKFQLASQHLQLIKKERKRALQHFFSHIKLVFHPEKGWKSKIYLGYIRKKLARGVVRTRPLPKNL